MKVILLDVHKPGDHKDFNGGFGTTFDPGSGILMRLLAKTRARLDYLPSLSYGYIAAILKEQGHEVRYACNVDSLPQACDLLIMHVSLIRFNEELALLKKLKSESSARICVIGPAASKLPQEYEGIADTIVQGEPEGMFIGLDSLELLEHGRVQAPAVSELDSLPYPDWSIYPNRNFGQYPILKKNPVMMVLGSRSCPYSCDYCPYIIEEKSWRLRSPQSVVDEILQGVSTYGIRSVLFRDPVFSVKRGWVEALCKQLIAADVPVEWACETRSDCLDEEIIDLMYQAGLRAIKMGVESADIENLDKHQRRPPEQAHQEKIVRYAESKGVRIVAFYILGFPNDTMASMQATIDYACKLDSSFANFTVCTPLPGTAFFNEMRLRISDHNWNHYDNFHTVMKLDHVSHEQVKRMQKRAFRRFYLSPVRLLRHIGRVLY